MEVLVRILLVNSPKLGKEGVINLMYPPLGLLYLAAYIREREGAEVAVIDGCREEYAELLSKIHRYSPDILGLSFTTQAATGAYRLINDLKPSRDLREKPFIVCGGPHATAMPQDVLQRSNCDAVVLGEGELTFHELVQQYSKGRLDMSGILGVAYADHGEIKINPKRHLIKDLDSLPLPARDLLDLAVYPGLYYKKERQETYLTSSRGCPFNCTYCSNPVWKHQKPWYRLRSPKKVVDEIQYIVEELGIREIYDQTDEFNGNMNWAKGVCDEIIRRGLKVSLKAQLRSDHVDQELAEKMAAAGFWLALFGVESGNARTLTGIDKRTTIEMNRFALGLMKDAGLKTFALLMAFNVWEEDGRLCYEGREETLQTLAHIKSLISQGTVDLMSWSLTTPYPGSKLYDIAMKYHLIPQDLLGKWELWDSSERMILQLPGITEKDWISIQNRGKKLQFYLLMKSGAFNLKSLPLYIKRGVNQIGKALRTKF
jgi:anaerobic magnesium-protoporphyrin IX monomethyl ester cyclase